MGNDGSRRSFAGQVGLRNGVVVIRDRRAGDRSDLHRSNCLLFAAECSEMKERDPMSGQSVLR